MSLDIIKSDNINEISIHTWLESIEKLFSDLADSLINEKDDKMQEFETRKQLMIIDLEKFTSNQLLGDDANILLILFKEIIRLRGWLLNSLVSLSGKNIELYSKERNESNITIKMILNYLYSRRWSFQFSWISAFLPKPTIKSEFRASFFGLTVGCIRLLDIWFSDKVCK